MNVIFSLESGEKTIKCHYIVLNADLLSVKLYDDISSTLNKLFSSQLRKQVNCCYNALNKTKYCFDIKYDDIILKKCLVKDIKLTNVVDEKLEFAINFSIGI